MRVDRVVPEAASSIRQIAAHIFENAFQQKSDGTLPSLFVIVARWQR